ncbi:MAG: hypothetical protein ACE5H3_04325 [Planctomycetota bacterium]
MLSSLELHEARVFSQNGEDGVIEAIFREIGTTDRFCVEFGVGDGRECNTRKLWELEGWTCLLMDNQHEGGLIHKEFITAENINALFDKYRVPREFDLLSIDIDGNDYWVWKALEGYRPRVVVVEYNASVPVGESRTIRYDPQFQWQGDDYFGASLQALAGLGCRRGYQLVYCEKKGVNAFFVAKKQLAGKGLHSDLEALYRPPSYGPGGKGHPRSPREMPFVGQPDPPNVIP